MIIDAISNGIVIDHITAGKAMYLYKVLDLDKLDCSVALLKNVVSNKLGRKDIIKIDRILDLDWDVIGYVDPGITVNFIKDGKQVEKRQLKLPDADQKCHPLQKPALHNLRGTGASADIHADRPGDTHIPLPVLRGKGRKRLIERIVKHSHWRSRWLFLCGHISTGSCDSSGRRKR